MKKNVLLSLMFACLFSFSAGAYNAVWQKAEAGKVPFKGVQQIFPNKMQTYALNDNYMKGYLFSLSDDVNAGQQIELPTPDGKFRTFIIWQSHLMAEPLASKYADIRTFTAYALDDPRATAKIDYTLKGMHAMVLDGGNTYFIDPYSNVNDGYYMCYYKRDFVKPLHQRMHCEFDEDANASPIEEEAVELGDYLPNIQARVLHGTQSRKYRLALSCTYEYAQAVDGTNPTKPGVLSAMVTSVNRVTGVYEHEMSIILELVGNTDTLIWITSQDSFTNGNGGTMLGENQEIVGLRIGSANYDIGHVFSTGGGGIATLGCVCSNNTKAQGVTGSLNPVGDAFDIDYVAHEMGHQFGGPHTFNNNSSGSCSGNRSSQNAYEPGSGSTIMAYAGICSPDDIQAHSDAYFHANSLQRIYNTIVQSSKNNCPVKVNTGNGPSGIPSYMATYYIPFETPFELTAPVAIDSAATDTLTTYCWEEYDRTSTGTTWTNTTNLGPIFRSFNPTTDRTRVFPVINKLVNNVTSYLGEKLPPVARTLRFQLTVRSIYQGLGATNFSDDSVKLNVINTTTPFKVVQPNTSNNTWFIGNAEAVNWDVSGTDLAPISCANVDIFLSTDGGYTYPITLATGVPNTGNATITVPVVPVTNNARVKVKGAGNVFFDISNANFHITFPLGVQEMAAQQIIIFPVPATDVLSITKESAGKLTVSVLNTVGQSVWTGSMQDKLEINVKDWAKGIYYVRFTGDDGLSFNKSVVVQ